MRSLLLAVGLIVAPWMAAETGQEPPTDPATSAKATGPLTQPEQRIQGEWKAYDFESKRLEYAMTFKGRDFYARARPDDKNRDEWYEGYIVLRTDEEPAQLDFVILVQSGEPNGRTSEAIFYFDGETVVVNAAIPEEPRPLDFKIDEVDRPTALLRLERGG